MLPGALSLLVNINAESTRSKSSVEFALQKAIQYPTTYLTLRKMSEIQRMNLQWPLLFSPPPRDALLNILFRFKRFHLYTICCVMFIIDCGLKISAGFFWQIYNRGSCSYNLKINWTKPIGSYLFQSEPQRMGLKEADLFIESRGQFTSLLLTGLVIVLF